MGNHTEAEDITQETFVRAWMNYPAFDVTRPFEAWVYRIAVNLCLDAKRRQARQPSVSLEWSLPNGGDAARLELSDTTFDPERCLLDLEVDDRLTTEIGALPSTYRACVLLLAQGHSYEQLATLLNCPLGTIRSRIHRARAQLRRTLKCSSAALPG
jgi:RNA polymerase sigma-70 factor (ECF subfamily)